MTDHDMIFLLEDVAYKRWAATEVRVPCGVDVKKNEVSSVGSYDFVFDVSPCRRVLKNLRNQSDTPGPDNEPLTIPTIYQIQSANDCLLWKYVLKSV